jgi:nitroreductase
MAEHCSAIFSFERDVKEMETFETIYTRRSIRAYNGEPVSRETLDKVLSGALMAPSWKNTQTAGYIVVESPEMKQKLMEALPEYNARTVSTAPVVVVMTTRTGRSGYERDGSFTTKKEDRWEIFDAGIACQTLCLAAWEEGLGTCIMGIYDEEKLPKLLQVPETEIVTAVISMGYPALTPEAPKRKTLEEKVRYV